MYILLFIIYLFFAQPVNASDSIYYNINLNREPDLIQNKHLLKSSLKRACDLNKTRQWSHNGYVKYFDNGYLTKKSKLIGENLARGLKNDDEVIKAWMNSTSHKANIMNSKFKNIGIGRCGDVVVAHFGE